MGDDEPKGQEQPQAEQNQGVAPQDSDQPETSREDAASSSMPDEGKSDDLPEDTSERTRKEFEKLKESNRRLKEQLEQKSTSQSYESVFDSLRPKAQPQKQGVDVGGTQYQNLSQGQAENIVNQFVDEQGNVDINGLNQALVSANQRASQAEQAARQTAEQVSRYEETRQTQEAYADYPQLDPQSQSFDTDFYDKVRDRLLRNMYEGKQTTLKQVASDIARTHKFPNQPKQEDTQRAARQSAGPVETGQGKGRQTTADLNELRERTRSATSVFNNDALSERLNAYFDTQGEDR